MDGPIVRLAKLRAISDSADIEAQLSSINGHRPILSMLVRARSEASAAIAALAYVDAEDAVAVRKLQNEAQRYADLLRWLKEIVVSGLEFDEEITAQERDEVLHFLSQTPEGQEEAMELGLLDRENNDA